MPNTRLLLYPITPSPDDPMTRFFIIRSPMITRRDFARLAGLATGTALFPSPSEAQQSKPANLPPSIAQLKSRKSEAKPIGVEERQQRQERARRLMRENNLDAILMIGGTSLVYFTNIHWWNSERFFSAVLPVKGDA